MLVTALVVLGVILFSMVLHELMHGLVAYWLGDSTAKEEGRLSLNPIKHIDPVLSILVPMLLLISGGPVFGGAKPVPVNSQNLKYGPWGMALVAIAGPLTNFLIAFLAFLVGHWCGLITVMDGSLLYAGNLGGLILVEMVMVNLGFGIFNLIPIPPLDGSRVLYAIAPDGVRNLMERMESMGVLIVMILVIACSGLVGAIMSAAMSGVLTAFSWVVGF